MQGFSKKASAPNKEKFVDDIARTILSGKWKVGEKLPTERELAAEFGISKTMAHTGLERLSQIGLLDVKPQSGTYVADYMKTGNVETLNAIVRFSGGTLSYELSAAILDLRIAIEGAAFQYLARRQTADDVALLRQKINSIRNFAATPNPDTQALAEMFFDWHFTVCTLSQSAFLPLFMNTMHDISIPFWVNYIFITGIKNAAALLAGFTDLIEKGDGDGALALMTAEIEEYLKVISGGSRAIDKSK